MLSFPNESTNFHFSTSSQARFSNCYYSNTVVKSCAFLCYVHVLCYLVIGLIEQRKNYEGAAGLVCIVKQKTLLAVVDQATRRATSSLYNTSKNCFFFREQGNTTKGGRKEFKHSLHAL